MGPWLGLCECAAASITVGSRIAAPTPLPRSPLPPCREEQRRWRAADLDQRHVDNARVLWARVVERNRRDVEEKSEQLRALANMAALLAGFSLAAFMQVGAVWCCVEPLLNC